LSQVKEFAFSLQEHKALFIRAARPEPLKRKAIFIYYPLSIARMGFCRSTDFAIAFARIVGLPNLPGC
jgi:hypothetical protein